jgi:membrane-associated phospholipid phosphatase
MVAQCVLEPDAPALDDAADLERRSMFLLTGLSAAVVGSYLLVGASGNFFQRGRDVSHIAWVWGGALVVAAAALSFAATCLVVVVRYPNPPSWVWPILLPTPLTGTHDVPHSLRTRWLIVWAVTVAAGLTMLAMAPRVLGRFDRALVQVVDESGLEGIDSLGDLIGSTRASVVAAVVIGVATLRCRRFAWFFIGSVGLSLTVTQLLRMVVDRPRPEAGPMAGATDSFPSGHLVQATLLASLIPLAVYELSRRRWLKRVAAWVLVVGVSLVAIERIANVRHEPTDVIAGIALGLAIGGWARLALLVPGSHSECPGCAMSMDPLMTRQIGDEGVVQG